PEPEAMGEEELQGISEEADFDGPLVDYKKKGNTVKLEPNNKEEKDQVTGNDVWRIKLTLKSGDERYYLFDKETYLLLKWEGKRKFNGREIPVESYFRDYRDVDGVKFAFEIDSGTSATDLNQKIVIDKIELNPKLEDARFEKPATPAAPAPSPDGGTPPGPQ